MSQPLFTVYYYVCVPVKPDDAQDHKSSDADSAWDMRRVTAVEKQAAKDAQDDTTKEEVLEKAPASNYEDSQQVR